MIVPRYWAECTERVQMAGRQFTIKRFGWSNTDQIAAQENAFDRTHHAIIELKERGQVRLVDHKVPYNGADGLPIREEIVAEDHDIVLTRNSYGAICLNTPNVLFADIDLKDGRHPLAHVFTIVLFLAIAFMLGDRLNANFIGVLVVYPYVSWLIDKIIKLILGGPVANALQTIRTFSKKNPSLNLHVYRTPNGFRVLCLSQTFDPRSESTLRLLNDLDSDPAYVRMCHNQNCFRARITPKPWRMGISRMRPNHGCWPISNERLPEREKWVAVYEEKSSNYSSARWLEQLGSTTTVRESETVKRLHDRYCQADQSDLGLA